MANKLYDENSVKAVADAIRVKNGSTEKYKLADMPLAIENIQTIPEGNCWGYIEDFKISRFAETGETLNVVLPKYVRSLYRSFAAAYGQEIVKYKTLIVSKPDEAEYPVTSISEIFYYNRGTEEFYMNFDTSHVTNFSSLFDLHGVLHSVYGVFDLSSMKKSAGAAFNCNSLKKITFKQGTICYSISFMNCGSLSDESIQSIIDGIAQVTTAQTITFNAAVKAKLTEEQIAAINEKGWTLA